MTDQQPEASSVASKLASGAALNFVGMLCVRLMGIFNIVVLTRLLTPDDFGIVAIALIAVGFTEALINRQFESALIRQADPEPAHFDTAFGLAFGVGLTGTVLIFAISNPMAAFFELPELGPVLRWLSVIPLLMGVRNPYFIKFEKSLNFGPRVRATVSSRTLMTMISILAAVLLDSYWALVIALISYNVIFLAFTWYLAESRPGIGIKHWKSFLKFGGWLTLAGLAIYAQRRFPSAILGRMAGTFEAGMFQIGNEIATTMTQQLITPIGEALFPSLMSVSDKPERLRQAYLRGQQGLIGIALPLGVGVAMTAPEVVRVLLGLQWAETVPIIAILTPVSALLTLTLGVNAVKMIDGETRTLFFRNLFVLAIVIPLTIGGYMSYGIIGLVIGQAIALLINLVLTLQIAAKATQTHLLDPLIAARRTFIAVAFMVAVLFVLDKAIGLKPFDMSLIATLGILLLKTVVGACTAIGVQSLLWTLDGRPDDFERQIVSFAQRLIRRVLKR